MKKKPQTQAQIDAAFLANGGIEKMTIVDRKICDLIPAEYNPRRLSEKQFSDLQKSFQNLGTLEPAVINQYPGRENIIISGHQRLKVAAAIGMDTYPCLDVSFPPKKEREANIRMNKNTGAWDMDILANDFDLSDLVEWGFEPGEMGIDLDLGTDDIKEKTFKNLYKIEIDCSGEEDQQRLFEELTKRGYECRILAL